MSRFTLRLHPIDALLLLMTVIWGSNFTIVKVAVRDIPEFPFNALRLAIAAVAFAVVLAAREGRPRLTPAEWRRILVLSLVGHALYQWLFITGLTRTTVANSSLIFAFTPIAIALAASAVGHERVPVTTWIGAVVSLAGIYVVVSRRAGGESTLLGNLLTVGAMVCWTAYTITARPMLATRSPLQVTGYATIIGGMVYVLIAAPSLLALDWRAVRLTAWLALVASALLALVVAYIIWYTAVQQIGSARTSLYSNVTPLVAIAVAALWLDEPITPRQLAGAAAVIAGLAIARIERRGRSARPSSGDRSATASALARFHR